MPTKEDKKAEKAARDLLKQEAKAEAKAEKASRDAARKQVKAETKAVQKVEKGQRDSLRKRAKAEKKPGKTARKEIAKEGSRRKAVGRFQKVRQDFLDLPPALWPFVLIVAFIWARNTWEKERQERDIREARRFLQESSHSRV